jgi:hypothetical protein
MRLIHASLFSLVMATGCYSELKDIDIYLSYSPELFFRLGMNYKFIGGYIRPCYNRNDKGSPYFTSVERIGAELGINLNRNLFETKYVDFIANVSGGFALQHVYFNLDGRVLWERTIILAIIPEIRFMKKVSLTISPCYIYYFPEKEVDFVATTAWKMPVLSILSTSLGIKLYY